MNSKILIGIVVVIILAAGGGYWYTTLDKTAATDTKTSMGDYAYTCDNGSQFSMTPSENMAEVTLSAGSQGMFTGTVTLHKMGDGNHYETTDPASTLIVFSGAGEEVMLQVGSESTVCNPVPNADMAPWNWGDAGEGGGSTQPDASLVVSESIVGKWQSTDDAKFVREFKDGDRVVDWYDGKQVSSGLFVAFEKKNAPKVAFPLVENRVYLQLTMTGSQADTLTFSVNKLTPEELELTYLDRGGVLRFKAVK